MSAELFEILCPACGAVVPPDAPGCSCASAASKKRQVAAAAAVIAAPPTVEPADVVNMRLKDYHRLVRTNYRAVEGTLAVGRPAGSRLRAYLPFALLVLGLLVGAGMVLGKF